MAIRLLQANGGGHANYFYGNAFCLWISERVSAYCRIQLWGQRNLIVYAEAIKTLNHLVYKFLLSRGLGDGCFLHADYLSIYRGRCSNDFSRSKISVLRTVLHSFFRFLHGILPLYFLALGQGAAGFFLGSCRQRYLLCSCHFAAAYGMGNELESYML